MVFQNYNLFKNKSSNRQNEEKTTNEDTAAQERFLNSVDASCVVVNASTRFNDGGQLGLGAELGISTTKIHAYGPMGAEQMTTTRFVVELDEDGLGRSLVGTDEGLAKGNDRCTCASELPGSCWGA